jgi:hypothetical protein
MAGSAPTFVGEPASGFTGFTCRIDLVVDDAYTNR